jgi:hypothetical protein
MIKEAVGHSQSRPPFERITDHVNPPRLYTYLSLDVATGIWDHEDLEKLSHRLFSTYVASEE